MNPIEIPQSDVKYCDNKNVFFSFICLHFENQNANLFLYDLFGHSSQTLFLSLNVGLFVFIQTGV